MHLRNKLSIATGIHSHQYYRATDSAIATNNMGRVVSSQRHLYTTLTISNEEPRLYPTENLEASGTAGKLRLSKLYCSERREPSGRFSMGIAEAI